MQNQHCANTSALNPYEQKISERESLEAWAESVATDIMLERYSDIIDIDQTTYEIETNELVNEVLNDPDSFRNMEDY